MKKPNKNRSTIKSTIRTKLGVKINGSICANANEDEQDVTVERSRTDLKWSSN